MFRIYFIPLLTKLDSVYHVLTINISLLKELRLLVNSRLVSHLILSCNSALDIEMAPALA